MDTIKTIEENSITLTKPSKNFVLTRKEIKNSIEFLNGEVDGMKLALDNTKNELNYYKGLLSQMPKEV